MKISSLNKVDQIKADMGGARDVYKQLPISKQGGSLNFSSGVFTLEPKGHTPFHKHPFERLKYIIKGRGSVVEESGKEHGVKKGDFVLVLPNEKHPYQNRSSKTPFMMICAVLKEYQ